MSENKGEAQARLTGLYFLADGFRYGRHELWQGEVLGVAMQGNNTFDTTFLVRVEPWKGNRVNADRLMVVHGSDMAGWNLYANRTDRATDRDRVLEIWEKWTAYREQQEAALNALNPRMPYPPDSAQESA